MGGAYLTLLNTIANMGVILPKTPVFALMDALTVATCRDPASGAPLPLPPPLRCPKKPRDLGVGPAADACAATGGRCVLDGDGFYSVSYAMICAGVGVGFFIMRLFPRLARLPLERWRAAPAAPAAAASGKAEGKAA
jgi:MFS transporter, PAT family, solute carrier family 33 (acetyl-CoA transportor), member 1